MRLLVIFQAFWALAVQLDDHSEESSECDHQYSYKDSKSSIFTSPNFPNNYPEKITCKYFFEASEKGRIKIHFDLFDLEDRSDSGCHYDYLDIYSVDDRGYKTQVDRFCGNILPKESVSRLPKLEIVFKSDYTKSLKGFIGHYEFLDENWQPFGASTMGCGAGLLRGAGGIIMSPTYPGPFPALSKCNWLINVEDNQKILLHIHSLDLSTSPMCTNTFLMIFNGFVTKDMFPDQMFCGHLRYYKDKNPILSTTSRVVIRFESGPANPFKFPGFKIVWTAVSLALSNDECNGFLCSECVDRMAQPCEHYCIDRSLMCNGVSNCAGSDGSDEQKCMYGLIEILLIAAYAGGPILIVIIFAIIIIYCYRRHKVRKHKILKTSSQEQPLTSQSLSSQLRSLEHSPSAKRSKVMHSTSFITGRISDEEDFPSKCKDKVEQSDTKAEVNDIPTYRTHQKRASYNLMKELCYEDGSVLIVQI